MDRLEDAVNALEDVLVVDALLLLLLLISDISLYVLVEGIEYEYDVSKDDGILVKIYLI